MKKKKLGIFSKLWRPETFWVAILGGAVIAGMNFAGVGADTQTKVVAIIATLLGAIGLQDFGKSATPPTP